MQLYQIRYFLTLCETLNFARAAERCNVSQPSLTRAVQKLEHELGGSLIHRERRNTRLTAVGELVRPMLKEVVAHSARVKDAAKQHLSGKAKVLRLGVLPSIGPTRLTPLLIRFSAEHPDVELTLVETPLSRFNDLLLSNRLDAMVTAYVARADKRLRYCPLYRERVVVVVPKSHRFEQLATVPLRDLQGERLLFRTNCEHGEVLLDSCRQQGFELHIVSRSGRENWVQTMVAFGFGITIMPEFSHTNFMTVARPLVAPVFVRELTLVTVAGRRQEPAMARLVRTFGMKPGQDEACDEDASSPPLVMVSKRIGSSSAELVARVIGTEGTVSSA